MRVMVKNLSHFNLFRTVSYLLIGGILLLSPKFISTSLNFFAISGLVLLGLWQLYQALRFQLLNLSSGLEFGLSGCSFALALLLFIFPKFLLSIIPVIIGLFIIFNGIIQLHLPGQMREVNPAFRYGPVFFNVLLIIGGLIICLNPFTTFLTMIRLIGLMLLIMGSSELIRNYFYPKQNSITRIY